MKILNLNLITLTAAFIFYNSPTVDSILDLNRYGLNSFKELERNMARLRKISAPPPSSLPFAAATTTSTTTATRKARKTRMPRIFKEQDMKNRYQFYHMISWVG